MNRDSLALGLAVVAVVPTIYAVSLPPVAVVRESADRRGHIAAAEKQAAVTAGMFVLAVAAVAGSAEVAALGLGAVFAFSSLYARARTVEP